MKTINPKLLVDMYDVVGLAAEEHGVPYLSFEQLIQLGAQVSHVYDLHNKFRHISFDVLCEHIKKFLTTEFGKKSLRNLYSNSL